MGVYEEVIISITGQIHSDSHGTDMHNYDVMLSKLKLVCAEYDLDLEDHIVKEEEKK